MVLKIISLAHSILLKENVGLEVSPGQNKEIIWNATEALGADSDGRMSFELRAKSLCPFCKFK